MSTKRRTRQNSKRVFQLSGFADVERKEMGKMITRLGGIDFDSQSFRANCTHIVCKKLSRSEKFLGGCATAMWILHPSYIRESSKMGHWLDEKYFDWSQIDTADAKNVPADIKEAPRRWRYLFEVFGTTAFAGWKTAVVVSSAKKASVYKSLLHSGGAQVYNLKLPVTQPEKVTNTLTYVFANDKCAVHVAHLIEFGVLCLQPDYIGDYLIKDPPPDPLDYLINVSEDSIFLDVSQNDRNSQMSDLDLTQSGPPSSGNSPGKKYLSLPGLTDTSSPVLLPLSTTNNQLTSVSDQSQSRPPSSRRSQDKGNLSSSGYSCCPKQLLHQPDDTASNSQVTSRTYRGTRSKSKEVLPSVCIEVNVPNPTQPVQLSNQKKRQFSEILGVEDALKQLKKLKVSERRFLWKPVRCVLTNNEDQQQHAVNESLAIKSYTVLMRLLQVHPPTSPLFTALYMKSLTFATEEIEDLNKPWQFIKSVTQKIIETPKDSRNHDFNHNIMLLKFLVALLEQNFKFCLQRYTENETSTKKMVGCMVTQVLWPGTSQFIVNNKCHELLASLSSCLSSELDMMQKIQILPLLLSLISMAAECCRLTENLFSDHVDSILTTKEERAIAFIHELSRNIDVGHTDEQLLEMILHSLQPAWLCLSVCLLLLNNMDDYLVLEGVSRDSVERISLHTIVNKYFFLLPKLHLCKGNNSLRPNTSVFTLKKTTEVKENESINLSKENKAVRNACKANKRNIKGETALHRACIRNDVFSLRKLLKIPGIDINAKDNAGWTPLHEACNHGHIQCVKELLNFVPSKTVGSFFSSGENLCRKADLLLSNTEGVTPLHDAVMNERLDVCCLLLQHGGWPLLQSKTINNLTPQDLAVTTNMRNLLLSFEKEEHIISSQGSNCSQDSHGPSDYLYDKVLGQEGAEQCSNRDDCAKYICLVTTTVRSYLEAADISTLISLTRSMDPSTGGISSLSDSMVPVEGGVSSSRDPSTGGISSLSDSMVPVEECVSSSRNPSTGGISSLSDSMVPVEEGCVSSSRDPSTGGISSLSDSKVPVEGGVSSSREGVSLLTGVVSVLKGVTTSNTNDCDFKQSAGSKNVTLEKGKQGLTNINTHLVDRVKSDLRIVKKLDQYVQQFENHVMRISCPVDHAPLKFQIMCLWCLAESSGKCKSQIIP
ncbi:SMC5-SMC6 complex localization factor protein 1-like [Ylistrum balloti]|uniref:SMC5-SMC6 complex localization factor protein 1-like n=1 Tax=Ylistrum balloti TaxID=509963 RepID=UPI002905B261|nr:SMC5-SMC6 complex localization factor protein 1-like [Ylistrum balloti]